MMNLKCLGCGVDRQLGCRYCRPCLLIDKRKKAKARHDKNGRHHFKSNCICCSAAFKAWRKEQVLCPACYKDSKKTNFKKNAYVFVKKTSGHVHRQIAESLLKRKLDYNEVVHHIDENQSNNNIDNLMVISRHLHGKLHTFLRIQRVIWEKSQGENSVNCWDSLRVDQTKAWLEMTGAKVIKLIELVNQQPSPLKGEGSETKDGTSEGL